MVTSYQITKWRKQAEIKKLLWETICITSSANHIFTCNSYDKLNELGFTVAKFTEFHEYVSSMTKVEATMFLLFIYHSLS